MSLFGERLKSLREKAGQTQEQVGKSLGKSRESISKYEMNERQPDSHVIIALARYFNVSTDYLLGMDHDASYVNKAKLISCSPLFKAVQDYTNDNNFLRYFQLAVKIKNSGLDIDEIEKLIDRLIRKKQQC